MTNTEDGAAALRSQGFVRLPGLVPQAAVPEMRRLADVALARPRHACAARPGNTLIGLDRTDALVPRLLCAPGLVARVRAATAAPDLRWISGYVSVKPAMSPPLAWHQDWWCWDHPASFSRRAPQVAVLIYLSDADVSTGALRVVPASHRGDHPVHRRLVDVHAPAVARDRAAADDVPGEVTLAGVAGDAVLFDYRLVHGGRPNGAAHDRLALLVSFTPDWRGLRADLRAHLIRHPAQNGRSPLPGDPSGLADLLPRFDGAPRDLTLNRRPPWPFKVKKETA